MLVLVFVEYLFLSRCGVLVENLMILRLCWMLFFVLFMVLLCLFVRSLVSEVIFCCVRLRNCRSMWVCFCGFVVV